MSPQKWNTAKPRLECLPAALPPTHYTVIKKLKRYNSGFQRNNSEDQFGFVHSYPLGWSLFPCQISTCMILSWTSDLCLKVTISKQLPSITQLLSNLSSATLVYSQSSLSCLIFSFWKRAFVTWYKLNNFLICYIIRMNASSRSSFSSQMYPKCLEQSLVHGVL